jgi:hypothetical protein
MQHFLNLERCSCGAYRYLAIREHKKSFEIYLIHHRHLSADQNVRKYRKLASIPKFKINIHDERWERETKRTIRLRTEEMDVLKSLLHQLDSGSDIQDATDGVPSEKSFDNELEGIQTVEPSVILER